MATLQDIGEMDGPVMVEKMVDFKDFFFETSPGQSTYSPNERHPPTMSIYLLMILIGSKCS